MVRLFDVTSICSMLLTVILSRQIMINIVVRSGLTLHGILVRAVMNAPMHVFAEVDSGVILNRFSQDMTLVDAVLPTVTFGTLLGKCDILFPNTSRCHFS